MRGLALKLLMDGLVGLDATLDAAVGAQKAGCRARPSDSISVGCVRPTSADTAQKWLNAEVWATRRFAEIDLDIPVSLWDWPNSTYGAFSREVVTSIVGSRWAGIPVPFVF
jgi:hypothetical protein